MPLSDRGEDTQDNCLTRQSSLHALDLTKLTLANLGAIPPETPRLGWPYVALMGMVSSCRVLLHHLRQLALIDDATGTHHLVR